MLRNSVKQAIMQIIDIIEQLQKSPKTQLQHLYCDLNIGKHIRHISDHFMALKQGLNTGVVDYNSRNRGTNIETDDTVAISQLQSLLEWINQCDLEQFDTNIRVFSEVDCIQTQSLEFQSNIAREFLYLINHTIHHAAHIGLIAKNQGIEIPLNTGMAPCTLTFMRTHN